MANKVQITVDIGAELTRLQQAIPKAQQALNSLKLPDFNGNNANDGINQLTKRINELRKKVSQPFTMQSDFNDAQKDVKAIESEYKSLLTYSNKLAKLSDNEKIELLNSEDTQKFKEAAHALQQYYNTMQESQQLLKTQSSLQLQYTNAINTQRAIEQKYGTSDINSELARRKQAYEDQIKKVEELNEAVRVQTEEYQKNGWVLESTSKKAHTNQKSGLTETRDAAEAAIVTMNQLGQEYEQLEKDAKSYTTAGKKVTDVSNSLAGVKKTLSDLKNSSRDNAFKQLTESVKKLDISLDDIKSPEDLDKLVAKFVQLRQQGVDAADDAIKQLLQTLQDAGEDITPLKNYLDDANEGMHDLGDRKKEIDQLAASLKNFFSIGNAISLFKRAIRSAYDTIQDLDKVMTETAVVTDFSVGDMWSQLPEYTQRANELGISIHSAYEAATIYYQQGLKTNEVMEVSNATLKMARIASLDAATASDRKLISYAA